MSCPHEPRCTETANYYRGKTNPPPQPFVPVKCADCPAWQVWLDSQTPSD